MNKLSKAQEERFDEKFPADPYGDFRGKGAKVLAYSIDSNDAKQHLADELAREKKKTFAISRMYNSLAKVVELLEGVTRPRLKTK